MERGGGRSSTRRPTRTRAAAIRTGTDGMKTKAVLPSETTEHPDTAV